MLRQLAFTLVAAIVLVLGGAAGFVFWQEREYGAATHAQLRILAALARGDWPADVTFAFRQRTGIRGAGAPPLTMDALVRGLQGGRWTYPATRAADHDDPDAPRRGLLDRPVTSADLTLADGTRIEVRTTRHGEGWRMEVWTGWGFGPVPGDIDEMRGAPAAPRTLTRAAAPE